MALKSEYQLLCDILDEKIKSLLSEIKRIDEEQQKKEQIEKIKLDYEKGIIDFELLDSIIADKKLLADIKQKYDLMQKFNSSVFASQKKKLEEYIDKIIKQLVFSVKSSSFSPQRKYNIYKKEVENLQKLYKGFSDSNFNIIVDADLLTYIDDLLKMKDVDPQIRYNIVFGITENNAELMQNSLKQKMRVLENKKDVSKKVKTEKEEQEIKVAKITKLKEPEEVKETIIPGDTVETKLEGEYLDLYNRMNKITSKYHDNTVNNYLLLISENAPINIRTRIYSRVEKLYQRCCLVAEDIKINFQEKLLKDKKLSPEMISIVNRLIEIHNDYQLQLLKNPKSISDQLEIHDRKDDLELLKNVENLLSTINNFWAKNSVYPVDGVSTEYNVNYYIEYEKMYNLLNEAFETYKISVEFFYTLFDEEEYNTSLEDLKVAYHQMLVTWNKMLTKEKVVTNEEPKLVDKLYGDEADVKNIISFISDGVNEGSLIRTDVEKDVHFNKGNWNSIIDKIKERIPMSNSEFKANAGHEGNTDNYSESFLKEYHVRGLTGGKEIVMYTRFRTNILPYVGEFKENPYVMVVLAFSPSNDGLNSNNYEKALARCYRYSKVIDGMKKLLNPDWDSMSNEEKSQRKNEIETFLSTQKEEFQRVIDAINIKTKGGVKIG